MATWIGAGATISKVLVALPVTAVAPSAAVTVSVAVPGSTLSVNA